MPLNTDEWILLHVYYPLWHFVTRFYLPLWAGVILLANSTGCVKYLDKSWSCFSMIVITLLIMNIKDSYTIYRYTGDLKKNIRPNTPFELFIIIWVLMSIIFILAFFENNSNSIKYKNCHTKIEVEYQFENETQSINTDYKIPDCNARYEICWKIINVYQIFFEIGARTLLLTLCIYTFFNVDSIISKRRKRLYELKIRERERNNVTELSNA